MAQITAQMPATTSSTPLNSIRAPQSQIEERRARYPGLVVQQPDQANVRGTHNLAEVQQGLKELQEKISSTLKRSSSAAHIRPASNTSTMMSPQAPGIVLKTESSETSQKTIDSFYQSRTNITPNPSTPAYVMSNVSSTALLRGNLDGFHMQSPQASSNKFYLGSLNPNYGRKEELLNSIKNYQVKTIHTLNAMQSSRTTQQSSHTFSHNIQPMRAPQSLGASMLSNTISIEGFQPGYDRERLDSVVSKIMGSQSFNGVRQESFMSAQKFTDLTVQDSLLTSKLDESNIPKRKAPQQARPVKKTQPAAKKVQKPSAVRENRKQSKGSYCDDFGADGDSMILEFIKEKDQLQDIFEDDFTGRTAKRGREVEEEQPQPKKLSKRQEILSSKRQVKGPAQESKKLRKDSNATSQSGEASQKNKRRN